MKTQFKRFSKSTISVLLAVCLLFSCMTVGLIATSAAQDDSAALGWNNTTWYLGNDVANVWDNSASNCTMTKSGTVKFYYDFYLKSTDADVYYRPYEKNNYAMGPTAGNNTKVTTTGTAGSGYNDGRCWYFDTADCTANKYNKIRIWIDTSGNSGNGWSWYEKTEISNISPTLSVPSTGTTGTAITLTGGSTDANKIGTLTKTYQYSTDNGSTWTDLSSGSYTATSAGTVKFRYKVSDAGTKTSGSGTNARTARVEYSSVQSCTFSVPTTTYTGISAAAQGTANGSTYTALSGTPATISASSYTTGTTALTITANAVSGYTFAQWKVTAGSGTIGSSTTASTTFTPTASNTTVTAQYKKNYTFSNGTTDTHGTVTVPSGTQKAGDPYSGTVTPAAGYKIKTLTVGGVAVSAAVGKTSAYTYSGTTGSSTTGTTTPISVVASFEPITNLQLYIAGRFRVRPSAGSSSWTTTYASGSDWNATSTNIPFTYVSGTTYKVDTYASLAELSAKPTNNQDPWFFVYDKTNSKAWHPTTQNRELGTTTEYNLTTNTDTYNVRFNSSSTDSPVTIYFDYNTKRLWYSIPDLYDVTCSTATGGSVTASPSRCEAGTAVTLTIAPTDGWELTGITTSPNVPLSGTGSTRTFTMPEGNVTVTPVFEKISYAVSVDAKYSNDGTNFNQTFPSGSKPAVTIAANTATQLDGVAVTAPATDPTGYKFAGWYTTTGSFENAANKDTTFKPNAANAVAIAKYKKIFSITSSVDNTGTGAGTVTTSVASVEAGGSYTITAGAKSGSAVESVKVNGTAKTATASQTISSVSENQEVVVKFKSNVYLKGTMNASAWAGDVMQANAAGTTYTISDVVLNAGTTYEFKHWVDSGGAGTYSTTVGTWTLNNIATHSTKSDGYGGTNLTITPSVKAKVTFVSDGTKFTSITAVPYNSTQYTVTLKKVAGATITSTYMGTEYTTASADATVQVYNDTAINFTVTADSDKYLTGITTSSGTLDPVFNATTHAATYTGAVTVTAATTITPAVADKLKVSWMSNKTDWGTVSVSPEYARPGDLITITCTPAAGTLSTLVAYDTTNQAVVKSWKRNGSGQMVVDKDQASQSSANQFTQVGLSGIAGSIYSFIKDAGEALGAADDSKAVGDDPYTFNMPNGKVSITATYEEYVGTSEYYYNYYSNSGKGNSTQMSEGRIDGNAYGYYNVTDRTGDDQPFTVSHRTEVTGTRYVYFTCPGSWNNLHVYFFDGVEMNWPGAEMQGASETGNSNYKYAIPSGAKKVIFNNGNNSYQTVNIDLTNTNGAYYVSSGEQSTSASVGQWQNPPGDAGINGFTETEYFSDQNDHDIYPASYQAYTNAGLFNDHGIGNTRVAKPKGDDFGDKKTDYYILVFYPGVTYTINDKTFTPEGNPLVYWSTTLPGQTPEENPTVKVYAKDGAIRRDGDKPERNDRTYSYFEQHANTFVYSDSGYASHIGTRSSYDSQSSEGSSDYNGYTYDYVNKFNKGDTLYIKTNLDSTLKENYYLAAYCINGKTYELHAASESDDGVVTEAFTVPEDWEDKYVEITPIYFLRDSAGTNTITFYIEGYDETVMNAGWGNTPFVYPFYQDANFNYVSNINNAFGGYPGQPMVFYKGNYYIQLPKEITTTISTGQTGTATIKGVTLGNGYWDDIHYHIGEVKSHFQTYDYDDLYKIYNEKGNADRIICAFKYRTKKNNDEPSAPVTYSNYNSTNGNGWEVLTNYYGQPVDVFGNVLSGDAETLARSIMAGTTSADTAAVVHAISQDYKSNSAGDYATEWVIYNTSGTKVVASSGGKTSIVPSALAINANTSGTGELTDNFDKYDNATKAFKSIYTALYNDSNVLNQPAVVTYEKSIYGGGDKADRCDARWYFSQKDALITATTRIEYTDDGKTWTTDEYDANTGTGHITRTKAYFTGKASTATDTPSVTTGIDDTNTTTYSGNVGQGYYTIKAENAGQYQFVGWYLLRDNYQNISTRSSYAADATEFPSHAEMSKNGDIFVARFKKTATGTFDIYHEIHPQTTGYGTVDVSAVVKKGDTVLHTYASTGSGTSSHIQIGNDYIKSGDGNTIVATFTAAPYHTSNFDAFYATVQDLLQDFEGYDYIDSISISGGTATVTYNVDKMFSMASGSPVQTVSSVTHYSKFSLSKNLTYSLQYTFNTRYYGTKLYKYTDVKFTEQELRSYFLDQITDPNCDHIKLDKQFVKAKAPFESNFREDLTWVVDDVTFNNPNDPTIGYLTATQIPVTWANATVFDIDNNGEISTTKMAAPIEKLFKASVHDKPDHSDIADPEARKAAELADITGWAISDNDEMYHPIRTSYTDGGTTTPLYIHHWDIYQLDSFTYSTTEFAPDGFNLKVDDKSKLVAQAYSSRFNYVGYEDYAIVPVYSTENVDRQALSDNRTDSSATLLTLTRNQWNANAAGNTDESKYKDRADRVYVDFMLNYNYSVEIDGKKTNILLNSTGDNIKVGFIVRSYTWENEQKQYGGKAQYVLVDKDQINDKNRMEYCFGFNNSENNRKAGLYYEFKPFIVDTSNQGGSAGCDVTIDNTTYKALYADSTVSVLDHVSFYQLGRL